MSGVGFVVKKRKREGRWVFWSSQAYRLALVGGYFVRGKGV